MQFYTFPISVQAYSEADARAKLNLLLAIGSFLVDFKIGNLAGAFAVSKLLECAGKMREKARQKTEEKIANKFFFEKIKKKD
jgi:hypothetical protein